MPLLLLALALVVPPHFRAGAGWHVGHGAAHACAGVPASRCVEASGWAATTRFRDCGVCIPHRTLAALPPDGIVIQLTAIRERPPHGRAGAWPPTLRREDVAAGFEGVAPRYGVVQLLVRSGVLERELWVWFGRARPTLAQLAAANAELRTG